MSYCQSFNPDIFFQNFNLLEFPISFVGLSTTQQLDMKMNFTGSYYLKTSYLESLMKFEEAREVSPDHRAYTIIQVNDHTLEITFKPTNECIAKAIKQNKQIDNKQTNKFIFDLRLINVDGLLCCNNEYHAQVGRYYISGQFEYCNISSSPKLVDFGSVPLKGKASRLIRIRNDSKFITAKINYEKTTGYDVSPQNFLVPPNSSKQILITFNANALKVTNTLIFCVRNPHDTFKTSSKSGTSLLDTNFLEYSVTVQVNIIFSNKPKLVVVESLHKIYEPDPQNTYLNEELTARNKRKALGNKFLAFSKSVCVNKKKIKAKICPFKPESYPECAKIVDKEKTGINYSCKNYRPRASASDLFDILFTPFTIDFGRVGIKTYGEHILNINNQSKFDVVVTFLETDYIFYTKQKLYQLKVKIKAHTTMKVTIVCFGFLIGIHKGTFEYSIDNNYYRKHSYLVKIGNPLLSLSENILKFGMVSSEGFITSVPVKIYNHFNVPVDFEWAALSSDIPFEIIPTSGTVLEYGCKICDIIYSSRLCKTRIQELDFCSKGIIDKTISIEAHVISKKLSVKFLQQLVIFKDVPLNLETKESVRLENSSREIALFNVLDPMFPGITIEPMSGVIRPRSIVSITIIVQICCVMDFNLELFLKINNKENVEISINGNVVEPKLTVTPKNVYMSRVPCGMITFVPVVFHNSGAATSLVEILDTGNGDIFLVYEQYENEKRLIHEFSLAAGQSKTVFVKVYDIFRREYEMFVPFRVNRLLGPPNQDPWSTEVQYYIKEYSMLYDNNYKAKTKPINKDINYFRISGVITVPWIKFSEEKFEIDYSPSGENSLEFKMKNISKYYLHVCVVVSKLRPHFSLDVTTQDNESIITDANIKFQLDRSKEVTFCVHFHPQGFGKFVAVAIFYLDKALSIPYSNLTFIGRKELPHMTANLCRIIFPPCHVGIKLKKTLTILLEDESDIDSFSCSSKAESHLSVQFIKCNKIQEGNDIHTLVTVQISVCCDCVYSRNISLIFFHSFGSTCRVEVIFCYTYCPVTLHMYCAVTLEENPYPFYPLSSQTDLFEYLETCTTFLERWLFQQGFRRELFPKIPDTFHAIANSMTTGQLKLKGMNISLLNFIKRIAGPLLRNIQKTTERALEEPFKTVNEIYNTYRSIIHLLRSRGASLWVLQAKFLLTHDQFIIFSNSVPPRYIADIYFTQILKTDVNLYNRLTKQCWLDFILQSYKVFVLDSCFFDCVCVSTQPRDIIKIIIDWYNEQIAIAHNKLRGRGKTVKCITNITTDLKDGIAIISTIYNHCQFLEEHLSLMCEVDENDPLGDIIHNACLIIEAMNILRLYFPISSKDFLEPNFLQMLFLSVHLYVTLPMFNPKEKVHFSPPLLRTSTRSLSINPMGQESLTFNYVILNNKRNCFFVEKEPTAENGKKIFLSVRYTAKSVSEENAILLVHGFNKTRIFDTYIMFYLVGKVGALNPAKKCKLTAPLYRPNKVDVTVCSPFNTTASFSVYVTDNEPTIPMIFEDPPQRGFYVKRLKLMEQTILLPGKPKDLPYDTAEYKLYLQMFALNTQVGTSWIWFRSEIGEFFIKVITQPRWDLALETLQMKVTSWPIDPCSCGEACECYRSTILMVPHCNELMLKALRYSLLEYATDAMINIYDRLIETETGRAILLIVLMEGGTNISDIVHILREQSTYYIYSKNLQPRLSKVTLKQHTNAMLTLPVTIPPNDQSEKFNITFTSDCNMDIRNYKILIIEMHSSLSSEKQSSSTSSS